MENLKEVITSTGGFLKNVLKCTVVMQVQNHIYLESDPILGNDQNILAVFWRRQQAGYDSYLVGSPKNW